MSSNSHSSNDTTPRTLADDPRWFLTQRAQRLVKILDLVAPPIIVQGEVRLIVQALVALIAKEAPTLLDSQVATMAAEYQRCMDALADVPGSTLEDRVTKITSDYLVLQLMLSEANSALQGQHPEGE